ncbi:Exopolyphosphatase [Pseudoloma neurophilia]|uniref:Exopolyphosphatase n=1 Tax=Pseudoloma neurophilia TaxID=146866 RepID=A0A0R0LST1_9MICR|nr:Exopolyphosphatase [Pseudoloma neurophilia]
MGFLKEKKAKDLETFLSRNKRKITHSEVDIAIGNEGCDLDSFFGSLALAYSQNVVHVVNMRRIVFESKGELVLACKYLDIKIDDLIFLERPMGNFSPQVRRAGTYFLCDKEKIALEGKKIQLYITDHNKPVIELAHCEIAMIIDHHALEKHIKFTKKIYIDVDVGSAATLVSKYMGNDIDKRMAMILIIPIICDTKFLKERTSLFDKEEYKKLKKIIGIEKKKLKNMRQSLKKARRNDKEQTTEIMLQKDLKVYEHEGFRFGNSTIKFDFEKWIDREGSKVKGIEKGKLGLILQMRLEEFSKDCAFDFYFVGCKMNKQRHLIAVNFPQIRLFAKQYRFHELHYQGFTYYKIPVELSRKIFMPMVLRLLEKKK